MARHFVESLFDALSRRLGVLVSLLRCVLCSVQWPRREGKNEKEELHGTNAIRRVRLEQKKLEIACLLMEMVDGESSNIAEVQMHNNMHSWIWLFMVQISEVIAVDIARMRCAVQEPALWGPISSHRTKTFVCLYRVEWKSTNLCRQTQATDIPAVEAWMLHIADAVKGIFTMTTLSAIPTSANSA